MEPFRGRYSAAAPDLRPALAVLARPGLFGPRLTGIYLHVIIVYLVSSPKPMLDVGVTGRVARG
jgi:hypothetical protein